MSNECLTCKYRGKLYNSVHSSCKHPIVTKIMGDHEALMWLMVGIVENCRTIVSNPGLNVEFAHQGIEGGWASWPFNFDPRWLENCNGYEEVK